MLNKWHEGNAMHLVFFYSFSSNNIVQFIWKRDIFVVVVVVVATLKSMSTFIGANIVLAARTVCP